MPKSELRHEDTQKKVERKGAEIRVEAMKKPRKRWRERVPKSELRHEETQKKVERERVPKSELRP